MTRDKAKLLSAEIMDAVNAIAVRHGFAVKKGGVVFGEGMLKINNIVLEKPVTVGSASVVRPAYVGQREFDNYKGVYGLSGISMGDQYTEGSNVFELIGFKTSAPKYPILVKNIGTGKTYKTTWGALKMHFRR